MELSLAKGWSQVEPRTTHFDLLLPAQPPAQMLVATSTDFKQRGEIGFIDGNNCPIAVDHGGQRVFVSADGVTSYGIGKEPSKKTSINRDVSPFWMLSYEPQKRVLLTHTRGAKPKQSAIERQNVDDGTIRRFALPEKAFSPLALNTTKTRVLYSLRQRGVALYEFGEEVRAISTLELPFSVDGGVFDLDERRLILGGERLVGWNTATGQVSWLCDHGKLPAIDANGKVWFSHKDGAVARLGSDAGS